MADKKISQLPAATVPLAGTELVAIVQSSVTKSVPAESIAATTQPSGVANAITYLNGSKVMTTSADLTFDSSSRLGIGAINTAASVNNSKTLNYGANGYAFAVNASAGTGVTGEIVSYESSVGAVAGLSFTQLSHFRAGQITLNSSTVTSQYGFLASSSLTGATNNYGFYGNIASGTNRWNFYGAGTAPNYFNGYVYLGQVASDAPGVANTTTGSVVQSGGVLVVSSDSIPAYFNRNADGAIVSLRRSGTEIGTISISTTAVAYNTTSDYRLKKNIVDAPSASNVIDAIKIRSFDWKSGGHQDYGVIAQELEQAAPVAVTKGSDENDMWGVDYSKLVPILVKEIQDLRARVKTLELK